MYNLTYFLCNFSWFIFSSFQDALNKALLSELRSNKDNVTQAVLAIEVQMKESKSHYFILSPAKIVKYCGGHRILLRLSGLDLKNCQLISCQTMCSDEWKKMAFIVCYIVCQTIKY